jgi:hypothetical protein
MLTAMFFPQQRRRVTPSVQFAVELRPVGLEFNAPAAVFNLKSRVSSRGGERAVSGGLPVLDVVIRHARPTPCFKMQP